MLSRTIIFNEKKEQKINFFKASKDIGKWDYGIKINNSQS